MEAFEAGLFCVRLRIWVSGTVVGLAGSMFHFWCPVPVQVRTNTQTNRQTNKQTNNEYYIGTFWQTLQPTPGNLEPSTPPLPKTQQSSKS